MMRDTEEEEPGFAARHYTISSALFKSVLERISQNNLMTAPQQRGLERSYFQFQIWALDNEVVEGKVDGAIAASQEELRGMILQLLTSFSSILIHRLIPRLPAEHIVALATDVAGLQAIVDEGVSLVLGRNPQQSEFIKTSSVPTSEDSLESVMSNLRTMTMCLVDFGRLIEHLAPSAEQTGLQRETPGRAEKSVGHSLYGYNF